MVFYAILAHISKHIIIINKAGLYKLFFSLVNENANSIHDQQFVVDNVNTLKDVNFSHQYQAYTV